MKILPVIDLMGGQVVRGVAGRRDQYRPVVSRLTPSSAPLDVAGQLAAAPADGWVRGVFPDALARQLRAQGVDPGPHGSYHVLSKYTLVEYTNAIVYSAEALYPELPLRQAVRQVGRCIYPAFFDSMVGKAIFAIAGRSYRRAG